MSENIIITKRDKTANGAIQLTGSKSECNRALIIRFLSEGKEQGENISDAADTVKLQGLLSGHKTFDKLKPHPLSKLDVGPAGTAMRFLTAYLTLQETDTILTGSERMKQ